MSKSYLHISDNNFKKELKIGYLVGGSNFTQLTYDVATILCKTINDFCLIKKCRQNILYIQYLKLIENIFVNQTSCIKSHLYIKTTIETCY